MTTIRIDGRHLSLEDIERVAMGRARVRLGRGVRQTMDRSRRLVEEVLASGKVVYGINTGFGRLCQVVIPPNRIARLQRNLVASHAAGVGSPLPEEVVRAMMLLRANVLAKGCSGVRPLVVGHLMAMLNEGIHPLVPEQGSVGASGDLAPLAHMALALLGLGRVSFRGKEMAAARAMQRIGLSPLVLQAKEGLALTNGTQAMTALGALTLLRAERLAKVADVAGALSLEVLLGTPKAFHQRLQQARPHRGQRVSARNLRRLLRGSQIVSSHEGCSKVQDMYSLRCMPQVHGAARDALDYGRQILKVEINSATDNPLVFPREKLVLSGGNFHGQPVAMAMDFAGTALCSLAAISERRIASLMDPGISQLPAFLTPREGLNSGFMMAQVTAASLVSESKTLAHPASVDSIPTSANQEDHVSMGMTAARQAASILRNAEQVIDFRAPLQPGQGTLAAYRLIRRHIPRLERDRILAPDLQRAAVLVRGAKVLGAVERAIGHLR
jgi:histidine ammonia-lyase